MSTTQETKTTENEKNGAARKRRPPGPVGDALRPEKVQSRLKAERVQEKLRTMPGWKLLRGGKVIDRVHDFPEEDVASAYAAFVHRYAKAVDQPVTVSVSGGMVIVSLYGARFLTDSVLDFARRLG